MANNFWDMLPSFLRGQQSMPNWQGDQNMAPTIAADTPLNFEQRVLHAAKNPVLNNPDGSVSTHRMAWGEADGKFFAYPTIVQIPGSTGLRQLGDAEAFEYALASREYRKFDTPHEAAAYADGGYKEYWNAGEPALAPLRGKGKKGNHD